MQMQQSRFARLEADRLRDREEATAERAKLEEARKLDRNEVLAAPKLDHEAARLQREHDFQASLAQREWIWRRLSLCAHMPLRKLTSLKPTDAIRSFLTRNTSRKLSSTIYEWTCQNLCSAYISSTSKIRATLGACCKMISKLLSALLPS
jgi:hypothetical protein